MSDNWQERANCLDTDPKKNVFFSTLAADVRAAKKICGGCPVKRDCLEYALRGEDRFGVFGGVDQYERRRAMQVNGEGHATNAIKPIRCPLCFNKNIVVNVKRRAWMGVTCPVCDLSWVAKRVVPRKTQKTQEKVTSEDVEPAVPADS